MRSSYGESDDYGKSMETGVEFFCKYAIMNAETFVWNLGKDGILMKHIKTLNKANLSESAKKGGCGKCQASCQSACKTSCTVGNQKCARENDNQ
jgi:predicted ribosomally synthesized six-cysteine peptide SCIFF